MTCSHVMFDCAARICLFKRHWTLAAWVHLHVSVVCLAIVR